MDALLAFMKLAIVLFVGGGVIGVFLKILFKINSKKKNKGWDKSAQSSQIGEAKPISRAEVSDSQFSEFVRQDGLLTQTEQKFFKTLTQVVSAEKLVSCKVRLEDIVGVRKNIDQNKRHGLRNRVKSSHIDFVLMDKETSRIDLLIELDDPSHYSQKAIAKDKFKNELTQSVGIPLLRVQVARSYAIQELISKIENAAPGAN